MDTIQGAASVRINTVGQYVKRHVGGGWETMVQFIVAKYAMHICMQLQAGWKKAQASS